MNKKIKKKPLESKAPTEMRRQSSALVCSPWPQGKKGGGISQRAANRNCDHSQVLQNA